MTLNNKKWEGVSPYETPAVKTLEVMSEGVLCGSLEFEAPDWGEGQKDWFE